ncbi:hypothetical protein HDV05_001507 [Chytridiales sp. JEL 0842]|nr:hypothetical protein HDV05_001507 [Chytridiales sp. JEL 0842]
MNLGDGYRKAPAKRTKKIQATLPQASTSPFTLWNIVPPEIRSRILNLADPLTQHLNNHGLYTLENLQKSKETDRKRLRNDIWTAALEMEWQGDLQKLPGLFQPSRQTEWYRLVRTKSFYSKLLKLRSSGRNKKIDKDILLHIAMRHFWLEFLEDPAKKPRKYPNLATSGGHLKYATHLQSLGFRVKPNDCHALSYEIAREGRLDDMKALLATHPFLAIDHLTALAAKHGHLKLLQFLREKVGCTALAFTLASETGQLDVVRYLHEKNEPCSTYAMDVAAENGHLDVVRFLHENRNEGCTDNAINYAAGGGHLEVVKFLHSVRQVPISRLALRQAARNGHTHVSKYLHVNSLLNLDDSLFATAVLNGHFEIVKYIENASSAI